MPKYSASDLRHRIEIYPLTRVPDGGGGYTETYGPASPPITLPAMVRPRTAGERFYAGQTASREQLLVVIRYRSGLGQSVRIAYGGRVFEVLALIDVEERHEWIEMECEERFSG
jgi:SPP1 family predicted phage head-tail adaptor